MRGQAITQTGPRSGAYTASSTPRAPTRAIISSVGAVLILLRVAIFGGVIFGVFFGLAYAARNAKQKRLEAEIRAELREGLAQGLYRVEEADALSRAIANKCAEAGIEVPPLELASRPATGDAPPAET